MTFSTNYWVSVCRYIAVIFAAIVIFIGLFVLYGWYSKDVEIIKIFPSFSVMHYSTAIGFLFAGMGIICAFLQKKKLAILLGTPLALIGTAVAFVIGFQNNSAYGRIWEARKIWGGIVNTSRTFGVFIQDMVNNEYAIEKVSKEILNKEIKALTYRHIAWMTALRHSMRASKPWETVMSEKTNQEWSEFMKPPERKINVEDDLKPYLSDEDLDYVMSKNNKQTAIMYLQSHHLQKLKEKGIVWEFSFLELEGVLQELLTLQGKSERIKNFPYPRQYATLGYDFVKIFILLIPFAVIPEFARMDVCWPDAQPISPVPVVKRNPLSAAPSPQTSGASYWASSRPFSCPKTCVIPPRGDVIATALFSTEMATLPA